MEALNLLALWQIDDEEDSFIEIDFTVPINRKTKSQNPPKPNPSEKVLISSLLARANSYSDSSKHSSNNIVRKYMKLIKPLYSKASKRKFPEELIVSGGEKKSPLGEVCRQLRKSRSTSSAVNGIVERRDDSLMEQHDGIQSAILHCRTSYYSSTDSANKSVDEEVQRRISI